METVNFEGQNINQNPNEAPRNKNKKLIWAGIILAALILSVGVWQYWQYTHSVYYQQMKAVKMIEKDLVEQDKWGGKTPEETVRLFTEAVKKGDFELASRYGKEEQIRSKLENLKAENKINQFLKDFDTAELKEIPGFGGNNFHLVINENGKEYWILSLYKSEGGTWKIVKF